MATLRKGLLWQQDILCYGNTEKGFIMATRYPLLFVYYGNKISFVMATERVYYGNKISFVMATLRKGLLWQQDILCYGNTEKGFIMATRYPLLWQH